MLWKRYFGVWCVCLVIFKKKKWLKRFWSDKKLVEIYIEFVNIFIMKYVFLNVVDIERMFDEKLICIL